MKSRWLLAATAALMAADAVAWASYIWLERWVNAKLMDAPSGPELEPERVMAYLGVVESARLPVYGAVVAALVWTSMAAGSQLRARGSRLAAAWLLALSALTFGAWVQLQEGPLPDPDLGSAALSPDTMTNDVEITIVRGEAPMPFPYYESLTDIESSLPDTHWAFRAAVLSGLAAIALLWLSRARPITRDGSVRTTDG